MSSPDDSEASRSSWRWTAGSSETARSNLSPFPSGEGLGWGLLEARSFRHSPPPAPPLKGRGERSRRRSRFRRQIADQPGQSLAQRFPVDDHIDHAVREQIFGALEAFGQLLANGRFD